MATEDILIIIFLSTFQEFQELSWDSFKSSLMLDGRPYITEKSFCRSQVSSKSKNYVILEEKLPTNEYELTRSWHPRR